MTTTKTCTVRNAVTGACGKPEFYSEGEFTECYEHAHQHGSLYLTQNLHHDDIEVGTYCKVKAYGGIYYGRVSWISPTRANAQMWITLADGREKRIRRSLSDLTPATI